MNCYNAIKDHGLSHPVADRAAAIHRAIAQVRKRLQAEPDSSTALALLTRIETANQDVLLHTESLSSVLEQPLDQVHSRLQQLIQMMPDASLAEISAQLAQTVALTTDILGVIADERAAEAAIDRLLRRWDLAEKLADIGLSDCLSTLLWPAAPTSMPQSLSEVNP